jgi:hypothetical protein
VRAPGTDFPPRLKSGPFESVAPPVSAEVIDLPPAVAPSSSAPAASASVAWPESAAAPSASAPPSASGSPAARPGGAKRASKGTSKRQEASSKRRTGPGGIYIPPPKDWFK